MNLKIILALLLAFFRPRVDPDPQDPAPDLEADDPQPELDLDPADPDPETHDDPKLAPAEELRAAKDEAKRHREDAERYQRELTEARAASRPQHRGDDETAREDARLAAADTPELEKWQIRANRELRAGRSTAQAALMQAQDVNDRTAFTSISLGDPVAKKYEARVEKELADMRAKGQNAPREAIYTYLLGKDMREGKFKKKSAAPAAGTEKKTVDRGRTPGVRSDVSGRSGAMSEHEKRAKRLENVSI